MQEWARQFTIGQMVEELARKPELVIVERQDRASGWARSEFDMLSFLQVDPRFRALWHEYRYDKTVAEYDLYRRR